MHGGVELTAFVSMVVHALESRGLFLERAGAIPRSGLLGNQDAAFPAFDAISSTRRLIAKDLFPYFINHMVDTDRDSHCQVFRILHAEFYGIKLFFFMYTDNSYFNILNVQKKNKHRVCVRITKKYSASSKKFL